MLPVCSHFVMNCFWVLQPDFLWLPLDCVRVALDVFVSVMDLFGCLENLG